MAWYGRRQINLARGSWQTFVKLAKLLRPSVVVGVLGRNFLHLTYGQRTEDAPTLFRGRHVYW